MRKVILLSVMLLLFSSGCADKQTDVIVDNQVDISVYENQITQLDTRIIELEETNQRLKEQLNEVEKQKEGYIIKTEAYKEEVEILKLKLSQLEEVYQVPILKLKAEVMFGMEMDYLIEQIQDDDVTFRVYDYQHYDSPDDQLQTMKLESLYDIAEESEDPIEVYRLVPYLDFGSYTVGLFANDNFHDHFKDNEEYREEIIEIMNKPFYKHESVILKYLPDQRRSYVY